MNNSRQLIGSIKGTINKISNLSHWKKYHIVVAWDGQDRLIGRENLMGFDEFVDWRPAQVSTCLKY